MTIHEQHNALLTVEVLITIRPATRADLAGLEWFGRYSHYRRIFRRTYEEQKRGRRLMLIATANNIPIGQIFIQFESTQRRIADGHSRAYLYSLRVMEMLQGRGIGTRLILEAESLLFARNFAWAIIGVALENTRARSLYERLGYRVFTSDPGEWRYKDEKGAIQTVIQPSWILEKSLDVR